MPNNSRAINRIFTKKVMGDLIKSGSNEVYNCVVRRYIVDPDGKTNGDIISEIYAHLQEDYRNEYYYMNTLLNKLLLGIHSLNTTTALSQVRIASHIADFVMINGTGKVYEIKSELDNFDRLIDQLRDYFKAFSFVSVLASEHELTHVENILEQLGELGEAVGIYVLTENDTIFNRTKGREPKEYNDCLDYRCIFTLLRKCEYENVLMAYFKEVPQVPPVFYFDACLERFCQIPILTAQELAFKELKKRNKITQTMIADVPNELKSVIYFSNLSTDIDELNKFLQRQYRR